MNIFKARSTWSNLEFVPLKLCIAAAYVIIGTYFHDFFSNYYVPLFVLFGITLVWTMALWIGKMRRENKHE